MRRLRPGVPRIRGSRAGARPARLLQRLDALDLAAYQRVARTRTPRLDVLIPPLTRSGDHGVLWLGIATGLAVSGSGRRRAALRGVLSLGAASAVANVPAKLSARRTRPELRPVPLVRQLQRQPTTSSFPSGHSASAAAFVTGVALEQPALAAPLAVLGAGVAYGRVHTGVHYPGDVVAGLSLGVLSALLVRRSWPTRPERPAVSPPAAVAAPALPEGEGLTMVVNASAGDGRHVEPVRAALAEALPQAQLVVVDGAQVDDALREAARTARVLGVCGGDGTVSTAAGIAHEAEVPLAVLPGGTLDHFAAELGVRGVSDLAAAVRAGEGIEVVVGSSSAEGDGGFFLNTFALGVYPELVRERERFEGALGKWPAMVLATARLLRAAEPVHVEVDGQERRLWTLFAGNGHYHPAGFAPSWRERLDDGTIDVRLVDATRPWSRTRLVIALLSGRLGRSRVHEQRIVARVSVRSRQGGLRLARDGEVQDGAGHLLLRAASKPLVVYSPGRTGGSG